MTGEIKQGDKKAIQVINAMAYQVAKEIGSLSPVVYGNIDAILLTGGLAHWDYYVNLILERVSHLAPVVRYPDECEMQALAAGATSYINGSNYLQHYQ